MSVNWTLMSGIALAVLALSAGWCIYAAVRTDLPWKRWRVGLLLALRLGVLIGMAAWCLDLRVDRDSRSKALDVVVVADRSISISPQGRQTVDQWVSRCRDGIAAQGGTFSVVDVTADEGRSTPLAEGIDAAMKRFSGRNQARLVVVTDGRGTTGELAATAGPVRTKAPLFVVPAEGVNSDSLVADLRVDGGLWKSVPAGVEVTIQSPVAQQVKLTLSADGQQADQQTVKVAPGASVHTLKYTPAAEGVHALQVKAEFEKDAFDWDNAASAIVEVPLAPRVIVVCDTPASVGGLTKSLAAAGMVVKTATPAELPANLSCDCIVMSSVSAEAMGKARLEAIEKYVRDGGSIVFCGGPKSYAPGGYVGSPIENVFPVLLTPKKEYPPFALAIVLDNSWSMNEGYTSAVGKIDLAKEIAIAALDNLNRNDWLVFVSFDSDYHTIIPTTKVDNLDPAKYEIARIGAFGMTNVLGGLNEASKLLTPIDAAYKHIVLISDGHETETGTDYSRFLAQLERTKITLTTIGIGLTPNDKLLNTLAYAGKGRYYHAKTVNQIPSLALQEAKGMEEQLIVTMPLPVKKVEDDLAFAGIEADQMPPLYGYNRTRARTHAWTPLTIGRKSDPLLARMRYGRGQSLAFTSAAASSWMKDWIDKKPVEYATFWRQAVASVLPTPYRPMEPAVIYQDGEATFDFAACGVGPLVVQREKAGQDRAQSEKVEGSDVRTAGASAVLVTSGDATKHAFSWSRTYGREFADGAKAIEQLKAFTQASGGKYAPTVEEVLAPAAATHPVQSGPDVWLVLAALLLVAELLVRRIPALTRVLKGRRAD